MSELSAPHFHNPDKAREYLEKIRWPDGPACVHCGETEKVYRLEGKGGKKGTQARRGLLKCGSCRKQFSVTVGTVFERSKIPLHIWLQGRVPALLLEEGHQQPPAPSDAGSPARPVV